MTKTPATNKQQLQTRVIVSNYKQLNTILIMRKTYPLFSDKTITEKAKYLGLTISNDLNWKTHINNITSKATNTLKFIKRNVKTNNKQIKETAYKTYVRPQLEYCSSIWHPWQKNLTYQIERVQRSAARYVLNDYHYTSSVSHMIKTLNWQLILDTTL
jgi:hypothetical protein